MHELSLALGILDIVAQACREQNLSRVERVRVRIGRAAGVMSEALLFSFDCAKEGTAAAAAVLEISDVPVGGRCRGCGERFTVDDAYVLDCPRCGGGDFTVDQGHELEVTDLEGEA